MSSALRICSNSRCRWRIASSSASSVHSSMARRSVLPTRTSRMGATSMSKSKSSPAAMSVALSRPVFDGTKSGDGGRSRLGSVCVASSISTGRSASASRYVSVCAPAWLRPSTAGGVAGLPSCSRRRRVASRRSVRSFSVRSRSTSRCAFCVTTCAAYVLPRTMRRSCMMFDARLFSSSSSRYADRFIFDDSALGELECT
mmetsp:Transcript_10983/g.36706  ORF Transcript_10983/g.36706 Transcript_10983/m.36706 type:complete len:200 (+) Transcript_10983:753-1352(+)